MVFVLFAQILVGIFQLGLAIYWTGKMHALPRKLSNRLDYYWFMVVGYFAILFICMAVEMEASFELIIFYIIIVPWNIATYFFFISISIRKFLKTKKH